MGQFTCRFLLTEAERSQKLNMIFTVWTLELFDSIVHYELAKENDFQRIHIYIQMKWPKEKRGPIFGLPYLSRDKNRNFLRETECLTAQERKKLIFLRNILTVQNILIEFRKPLHSIQKTSKLTALQSKYIENL